MAVQNCAGRVCDRVLLVVAFGQYGVERGDRAATALRIGFAIASALDQSRQLGKHGRRVAFGGWRLANCQSDFALGHGIACQRIHDQQDVLPSSRKNSARRVAYTAPCKRSRARYQRARRLQPSVAGLLRPGCALINSFTSRPCSPIRPTTIMSAWV